MWSDESNPVATTCSTNAFEPVHYHRHRSLPSSSHYHIIIIMSSSITVFCAITSKNGERVPLQVSPTSTCTDLRQQAAEATKIPLDQLRLIFRGKMIKDEAIPAVETYKLEPDCVLHCMGKPVETTAEGSTASAAAPAASLPSVPAAVPTIPVASAPSPSAPVVDPLATALQQLRSFNSPQIYATALSTLAKILANIAEHPMEEKYRKVKQQNVAFAKRLGGLNGGDAAMRAVGFVLEQQEGVPVYQLHASPEAWPKLMAAKATIDAAVIEAERALTANITPPAMPAAPGMGNAFGGVPGLGGLPGANAINNNPAMQAALANMLSNPEAMRAMLQASFHK